MDHLSSPPQRQRHSEDCQDISLSYLPQSAPLETQPQLQLLFCFVLYLTSSRFHEHHVKTIIRRNRLTEIFGGTPGPRFALAQGEATLSAQETPHPCPACGRARSSQPPFTPGLEVDAAKECPRTPLCCSSPELTASEILYPARQIKCT